MVERYVIRLGHKTHEVTVQGGQEGLVARVADRRYHIKLEPLGSEGHFWLLIDERSYEVLAVRQNNDVHLLIGSRFYALTLETGRAHRRPSEGTASQPASESGQTVVSPMMGVIVKVMVQPGQQVEASEVLLIIESMKMNNELRARHSGTVETIYVQPGERITPGTTLLVLR